MKFQFSRQIFEKYSSIKFHENPPGESPSCSSRTDRDSHEANSRFSQFYKCLKKPNMLTNECMIW
jgi:hypothetical protein